MTSTQLPRPALRDLPQATPAVRFAGGRPWRRRVRTLTQRDSSDCGATCLAMIAGYWGRRFRPGALREQTGTGRNGTDLASLAGAAERLGFSAQPLRASAATVDQLELPAILHWDGNHFVVLESVGRRSATIVDPATGRQRMTRDELARRWTGYLLELTPGARLAEAPASAGLLRRLWPVVRPQRGWLIQIAMACLVIEVLGLAGPVFLQQLIDRVSVTSDAAFLDVLLLGLAGAVVASVGLGVIRDHLAAVIMLRIDHQLMGKVLAHLLALPLRVTSRYRTGDLLARFGDARMVRELLTVRTVGALLDLLFVGVYVSLMLTYDAVLTVASLSMIGGFVAAVALLTPTLRRRHRRYMQASASGDAVLVQALGGLPALKVGGAEQRIRWCWQTRFGHALGRGLDVARTQIGLQALSGLMQGLATVVLLYIGLHQVIAGELTIGGLMAFHMLSARAQGPVLALVGLWPTVQQVRVAMERLGELLDQPAEGSTPLLPAPRLRGTVAFRDVSFRHGGDGAPRVLDGITFDVAPGERVAIVGRSGSGKTTLGELLLGLQPPTEGRILVDDHELQSLDPVSLRDQMAGVLHDPVVFDGRLLDNITLWDPQPDLERVVAAARLAHIHDVISVLPQGYLTVVGEMGFNLSAGQRQRVTIARALYQEPRILVLDEATSALDTESERIVQENLWQLDGVTLFTIAHRIRTVRHADRILVLDGGRLVEQGTFDQLMAAGGLFSQLASGQLDL